MAKFRLVLFIVQCGAECPTIRLKLLLDTVGMPDKFHSKLVYVGLAQARPNNTICPQVSCQSVLESLIVLLDDDLVTAAFVS